ncbi:MAG: hypothetical protein IPP72_20215 [Chitinophagaceae bacterium]|nr:hypothetical protein [Chitinophagaceae bacterium]
MCNLCFIAAVILRWVEILNQQKNERFDGLVLLKPLESTLVVLGYGAILINLVFNIICLLFFLLKRPQPVAKWLIWVNLLFLLIQVYYFFF